MVSCSNILGSQLNSTPSSNHLWGIVINLQFNASSISVSWFLESYIIPMTERIKVKINVSSISRLLFLQGSSSLALFHCCWYKGFLISTPNDVVLLWENLTTRMNSHFTVCCHYHHGFFLINVSSRWRMVFLLLSWSDASFCGAVSFLFRTIMNC